jgi:DNA-binding GntR family transcriptional regulator
MLAIFLKYTKNILSTYFLTLSSGAQNKMRPTSKSKKAIVYENLKKKIITHFLKPGDPLNENLLSKELRTSKTPVREAMQQLEKEGFIENISGKGSFVSRISFQDIRELFEIREILECEVVKRAALKSDPDKVENIKKKFETESNGDKNSKNQLKAGDRIHAFIFESFGNKKLLEYYTGLQEHITRMRLNFFSELHQDRFEQSFKEHVEIMDALIAQDPLRAEKAMKDHLRNATEYLKKII